MRNDDGGTLPQGALISIGEFLETLEHLGAEKDENGAFKIFGYTADAQPPAAFLGMNNPENDLLVNDTCYCMINGEKKNLLEIAQRFGRGVSCCVVIL